MSQQAPTPSDRCILTRASVRFEAARRIDSLAPAHRSHGLHGHGFVATALAEPPADWAPWPGGEAEALRQQLLSAVAPLDYTLLNDSVTTPTDGNVAAWLRSWLDMPGVRRLIVQSTPDQGFERREPTDRDGVGPGRSLVWRRYRFSAAHQLPHVPPGHKCGRLHGHGFAVIVYALAIPGDARTTGYERLDAAWAPLGAMLDHHCLNDLAGLENPTSEMLAAWIWQRLAPLLPGLSQVAVYETPSCGAVFDGEHYQIWKDFSIDSAVRLAQAPEGHPARRVHGHTWMLRLKLRSSLDEVMGWTVDFGDVKAVFDPVFKAIDHQPLHEALADARAEAIVDWIHRRAHPLLPALCGLDLIDERGDGVTLVARPAAAAAPASVAAAAAAASTRCPLDQLEPALPA